MRASRRGSRKNSQPSIQGIGSLIRATFSSYRRDFLSLVLASACVLIPYFILDLVFNQQSTAAAQLDLSQLQHVKSFQQLAQIESQAGVAPQPVTWVLLFLNLLVVTPLLYGIIVQLVLHAGSRGPGGARRVPVMFAHAFARVGAAIGTLVLAALLVLFVAMAGSAVVGLFVAVLSAVGLSTSTVSSVAVLLSLVLLCVVVWVVIKLVAVVPVVYAERLAGVPAIGRSVQLSKRRSWHIIGFIISIYLITTAIRLVVAALVYGILQDALASAVISDILQLFIQPFLLVGMTLLYINLAREQRSVRPGATSG